MVKLDMPIDCRQIVVAFNKSFRIFPSTNDVERFCRLNRLEVVTTESQFGSFIVTLKRADSTI
jgi:hypothetical protein